MLRLRLLGELEVWRDDKRQNLPPSRKTRALLGFLVATGRAHRRERLCSMFWEIPDDPRGSLRWSLSRLRSVIGSGEPVHLLANRESVSFDPSGADIDLLVLRQAMTRGLDALPLDELREIASSFRGEFLEGLELPNQHEFQTWCLAEREDLRRAQIEVLTRLAAGLAAHPEEALAPLRQLVEIDPYGEPPRLELLRTLLAAGREHEAERQFDTAERLFRDLGGDAASHLARQWRTLRSQQPAAPPDVDVVPAVRIATRSQPVQAPLGRMPFVGRTRELGRLATAINASARLAEVGVTLLLAEPGLGKSRLIAEACARAAETGVRVFNGRAYDGGMASAYAPWAEALGGLPEVAPEEGLLAGRERLFGAVIAAVLADASTPVLVALDDMHWSDEASADLLHQLVRTGRQAPLSVIVGARVGELADNAAMSAVLRSLRGDGLVDEMHLQPLSSEATLELAIALAPAAEVDRVVALGAGNPLFIVELARDLGAHGDSLPVSLRDLLRERLERLPHGAAELIRWAAILGPSFEAPLLQACAGLAPMEFLQGVDLVERHGMIHPSSEDRYAFNHELVRHGVLSLLSSPRRKIMHRRVAEVLSTTADSDAAALDLANHAAAGGDHAMAAQACVRAGRKALRVFAHVEAMALVRAGQHYADKLQGTERLERLVELADIEVAADRMLDRAAMIERLTTLAESSLDAGRPDLASRCYTMLAHLRWQSGEWQGAKRDTLQAEFVSRVTALDERVVAMAEAARCLAMLERDLEQAEALVLEADALARRVPIEPNAIADALGLLRAHEGAFEEAAQFFARAREIARRDGDRLNEFLVLEHNVLLGLADGGVDPGLCGELVDLATRLRPGSELAFAQALLAVCDMRSDIEDAAARLGAALDTLRATDAQHRLCLATLAAARAFVEQGELTRARELACEALTSAERLDRPSDIVHALAMLVEINSTAGIAPPAGDLDRLHDTTSASVSAGARAASERALAKLDWQLVS